MTQDATAQSAVSPHAERTAESYLGPARVLTVEQDSQGAHQLSVEQQDGSIVQARWAVAFPYTPRRNDKVLVLAAAGQCLVIGVLSGRGVSVPKSRGRMTIRAVAGELRLMGKRGVSVAGPNLNMLAERQFIVVAERLNITVSALQREVAERYTLMARDWDDACSGTWLSRAKRVALKVTEALIVQGRNIRVG